ncbi:hypothetical protein BKM31_23200 [[Actinomadura] parvosata subsp. kistnae]|uniref:Uncharacterized protein n=1 Tax=[Actinomadura] parvosata subsp. kistnae TaxID=1909395 RepID=A0A1V0A1B1_9ACTN|nr:hypothetical protein BKM31_23200 [Nonomuraea sp. ATCC 55076]
MYSMALMPENIRSRSSIAGSGAAAPARCARSSSGPPASRIALRQAWKVSVERLSASAKASLVLM